MSDQPQYQFVNGQWEPINPNKPPEQSPTYGDNQLGSGGVGNVKKDQSGSDAVLQELQDKGQLDPETAKRLQTKIKSEKPVDDSEGFKKAYKPSTIEVNPNEKYTADKLKQMDDDHEFTYHFNVDKLMQDRNNLIRNKQISKRVSDNTDGPTPPFPSQQGTQDFNQAFEQTQQPVMAGPPAPDFVPQMSNDPRQPSKQTALMALQKNQQGSLYLSPENIIKFKQIAGVK